MKKNRRFLAILFALGIAVSTTAGCGSQNNNEPSAEVKELYEPLVEKLCDAKETADLDAFLSLFGAMRSLMETVVTQDILDQTLNGYKESCGENPSLEYEITETTPSSSDEIKRYQTNIELFGETGKIQRAYDLSVKVTVNGDNGSSDYTMDLSVGEVLSSDGTNKDWIIVEFDDTLLK